MRKAAKYETIDGHNIIYGFYDMTIDPAKTTEAVNEAAKALPEIAQARAVQVKIKAQTDKVMAAGREKLEAVGKGDTKRVETAEKDIQAATARIKAIEAELAPISAKIDAGKERLFYEKAAYFAPAANEQPLTEAEAKTIAEKLAALGEHGKLTVEGEVVPDWRGVEYWIKTGGQWAKAKIECINVEPPAGAVCGDALTPEQQAETATQHEAERITALTPEQKAAELQAALDAAADEAARLEKRDQIQRAAEKSSGESGTLALKPSFDATAWYTGKKTEIETKYAS
jgi:hypothetical protein